MQKHTIMRCLYSIQSKNLVLQVNIVQPFSWDTYIPMFKAL